MNSRLDTVTTNTQMVHKFLAIVFEFADILEDMQGVLVGCIICKCRSVLV